MDVDAIKMFLEQSLFSSSLSPQSVTVVDSASYHTRGGITDKIVEKSSRRMRWVGHVARMGEKGC